MKIHSVTEADVRGKRVLLRTSLNLPILADGSVGDLFRLKRGLATIQYLTSHGAKVVLVGYIGRDPKQSLRPVAEALQKLVPDIKINFTDKYPHDCHDDVANLPDGECLMLENMRREPGEETNDSTIVKTLASLADLFVEDSFAEAHRAYASNVGVAKLLPSFAGLLLEEEIARLTEALTPPKNSLAIIGGAKFETKVPLIEKIISIYPTLLLGGALASDMLRARGMPTGRSLSSDTKLPTVIAKSDQIHVPSDVVVESDGWRQARATDVRQCEMIVDIGAQTATDWAKRIAEAEFVLWNGPMGVYERGYVNGVAALARALAESPCKAVIGGGDTVAALDQFTFDPARVFISTGGGATLDFLANGGSLPALEVLKR